jgi:hypothetical protein
VNGDGSASSAFLGCFLPMALPLSLPRQTRPVEPGRVNAPVSRCSGLPRPRRTRARPAWGLPE